MLTTTYTIRTVASRDAISLHDHCWPDHSLDAVRELLHRADTLARRGRGLGVVAQMEGRCIGYAQLTSWPRVAEISDLIVAAPYRSHGIGTALIQHLIEQARNWRSARVEIGVAASNPRAYALYKRLGFNEDRVISLDTGHGEEPVTYLVMPLNLP